MRGTWDDLNRRLTGALLGLDLGDGLTVGERQQAPRSGLFGRRTPPRPHRWVSATATRTSLLGECVGSASFGGDWPTDEETERRLVAMGWERPWSDQWLTWQRTHALQGAPRLALAMVRALEVLGADLPDLEVTLDHDDTYG